MHRVVKFSFSFFFYDIINLALRKSVNGVGVLCLVVIFRINIIYVCWVTCILLNFVSLCFFLIINPVNGDVILRFNTIYGLFELL